MKKLILSQIIFALFVADINADYRDDYASATEELNANLCSKDRLHPKTINNVTSFFYDLILYRYAIKTKDKNLKKQCIIAFRKLTTPKLVNEIGVAVQYVYGDEKEPEHLSLYALRGFSIEIRIILHLFKNLLNNPDYDTSLAQIYKNYQNDLWLEYSY